VDCRRGSRTLETFDLKGSPVHAEHKGPLFAFVVVAILCGVLLGQAVRGGTGGGTVASPQDAGSAVGGRTAPSIIDADGVAAPPESDDPTIWTPPVGEVESDEPTPEGVVPETTPGDGPGSATPTTPPTDAPEEATGRPTGEVATGTAPATPEPAGTASSDPETDTVEEAAFLAERAVARAAKETGEAQVAQELADQAQLVAVQTAAVATDPAGELVAAAALVDAVRARKLADKALAEAVLAQQEAAAAVEHAEELARDTDATPPAEETPAPEDPADRQFVAPSTPPVTSTPDPAPEPAPGPTTESSTDPATDPTTPPVGDPVSGDDGARSATDGALPPAAPEASAPTDGSPVADPAPLPVG
jgi:hypothetical protein